MRINSSARLAAILAICLGSLAASADVLKIVVDDTIHPLISEHIDRAIQEAQRTHAAALLITFGAVILCIGSPLTAWLTSRIERRTLLTTTLAVLALPLILRTMWLSAVRRSYAAHRRIAVWTFPVWAYVSVTGVIVYWMLYRL